MSDNGMPTADKIPCSHDNYKDYGDGMCYEGCCNRYICLDCGKIWTEEVGD